MTLLSLLSYAAPYRMELALASVLMLLETAAALIIPWLGGRFAGELLSADVVASRLILPSLLVAFAIQAALRFVNGFLLSRVSERILADLRIRVYDHLQALPLQFFHERAKGDILALITREVPQLSGFITGSLIRVAPMGLAMGGAFVQMARTDWLLAALVAVQIPAFFIALKVIGRRLRSLSSKIQAEEATSVAIAEENLGMLPIIKNLCREPTESRRYGAQIREVMRLSVTQSRIHAALEPTIQFIAAAAVILLLGIAERRIAGGQMTPGALVGFLLYAVMLTRPIGAAADLYGQTRIARGTLERLHRVMGERPEPIARAGVPLTIRGGEIVFRDVRFAYPGRPPALNGANLRVFSGETLALTGPNGAGKSSLMHLLMRLYDPDSGQILIDGVDIAKVGLHSLREKIGVVTQHTLLLNASVRENIGYGDLDADNARIERAARLAQAHEFISNLPRGYDTLIGDSGVRLSGGERQRVALARALLKNPPILILDEATSMFDPEGEASFIAESQSLLAQRTVILITHRPASLTLADRVVRLEAGVVSEHAAVAF